MSRFKGYMDFIALVLVCVTVIISVLVFIEINNYLGILKIKGDVDVYLDIDDRGSQILSLLRAKKNDMTYMGIMGSYAAENVPSDLENEIIATLGKMGTYHVIIQSPTDTVKEFKSVETQEKGKSLKKQIRLEWPVKNYNTIRDGYGWRTLTMMKDGSKEEYENFHGGIDFAVREAEVYAVYPGTVVKMYKGCEPSPNICENVVSCSAGDAGKKYPYCCCQWGKGNFIVLKHSSPDEEVFYTHYVHLKELKVTVGEKVPSKKVIGISGRTGLSKGATGYHLHFELGESETKSDEKSINPCPYFPEPVPAVCEQESHRSAGLSVSIPMPNGQIGNVELKI